MSKQSEAKEKQGYNPKPIPPMCSNCIHFRSDMVTNNAYGRDWVKETNLRCGIGEFAVKKQGKCNHHQFKEQL